MGSRRRRHAALIAGTFALGACTAGAPPAFSGGNGHSWTFPLVGSLEGGPILAPVMVGDRGPYLFEISPRAPVTILDAQVVVEAKLRASRGGVHSGQNQSALFSGSTSSGQPVFVPGDLLLVEVPSLRLGDLTVGMQTMLATPRSGLLDVDGRRIHGLIGRDVLRDTTVFGFDRDRAIGSIHAANAFVPPAGALPLAAQAQAEVNGGMAAFRIDLAAVGELDDAAWQRLHLESVAAVGVMRDEFGHPRPITKRASPVVVKSGSITASVTFVDRRNRYASADGSLGIDFFDGFDVWALWGKGSYLISKRSDETYATRAARWGNGSFAACKNPGCITLQTAGVGDGRVLVAEREPVAKGVPLEVLIEPRDKALPRLSLHMPAGIDKVQARITEALANAELAVVDVSRFPRTCPTAVGCIVQQ